MKKIFFTPGPCQLYPTVAKHIANSLEENISSISHRGEKFHQIFQSTQDALRKLLKIPREHKIFFLSSGTEAMERIIENTVAKYSLHFVNGAFSERFYKTAEELGKKPVKIEAIPGEGFSAQGGPASGWDFGLVRVPAKTELICLTHNETSTGVALSMDDIYEIKNKHKNKLIALDTVSSAPYVNVNFSLVDLCFFSVQKGFGLPAGLGVVIVSPAALEKHEFLKRKKISTGSFHSFDSLMKYLEKNETPETPNVLGIYLLGKVAGDMLKIGIRRMRRDTEKKAQMLYGLCEGREGLGGLEIFVKDERNRSQTVVVLETKSDSLELIAALKKKGLVVGSGYKDFKNKHIRIANFPAHTVGDIKRLIREIKNI